MWDSAVEKVRKDVGGNQEEIMSVEKFGRYKTEIEERIERRERVAPRNKVKSEKHFIREVERKNRNKNVFARLMDFAKTLKLPFRVGDMDLPGRKSYTGSREEGVHAQMIRCARVANP